MKIITTIAVAAGVAALAACSESPREERAENIEEAGEAQAENIMDTAENRAETVEEQAENRAENVAEGNTTTN